MTSMSYHPGGVNCGVCRRFGALHQELDQFVELDEYHASHNFRRRKCTIPAGTSARRVAVAFDDHRRRGDQLRLSIDRIKQASRDGLDRPGIGSPRHNRSPGEGVMRPRWFWLLASPLVLLTAGWGVFGYYHRKKSDFEPTSARPRVTWPPVGLLAARAGSSTWSRGARRTARPPTGSGAANKHATTSRPLWRRGTSVPAEFAVRDTGRGWTSRRAARRRPVWHRPRRFSKPCRVTTEPDAAEVRQTLELVYRFQGRMDDVRRLIVESWIELPTRRPSFGGCSCWTRPSIRPKWSGSCWRLADPEDDRIWLAKANRAILSGQPDEAARWLARARPAAHRPGGLASRTSSWRGPRATLAAAFRAMEHLPAGEFSAARTIAPARLVRRRDGRPRARTSTRSNALVAEDPGDTAAWDRLAELALARRRTRRGRAISAPQGRGHRARRRSTQP